MEGKGKGGGLYSNVATSQHLSEFLFPSLFLPAPLHHLKCPVFKHSEGIGRDKGKEEACFYGIFIDDFLLEIFSFLIKEISGTIRGKGRDWKDEGKEEGLVRTNPTRS